VKASHKLDSSCPIIHCPGFVPIVANAHSVFATSCELNSPDLSLGITLTRCTRRLQILRERERQRERLQILQPLEWHGLSRMHERSKYLEEK
jgi:hypothetical protein